MDVHRIARVRVSSGASATEAEEVISPIGSRSVVEEPSDVGEHEKRREAAPEEIETIDNGIELGEESKFSELNSSTDTRQVALVKRVPEH